MREQGRVTMADRILSGLKFCFIPELTYEYRVHRESLRSSITKGETSFDLVAERCKSKISPELLDRIKSDMETLPIRPYSTEPPRVTTQHLRDLLAKAEIIVADDCANYCFPKGETKEFQLSDFFNVAPPFPVFWIEFSLWGTSLDDALKQLGILFEAGPKPGGEPGFVVNAYSSFIATDYAHFDSHSILEISHEGRIEKAECGWPEEPESVNLTYRDIDLGAGLHEAGITAALVAIQFMHCKNVSLAPRDPAPKLSKAFQKRHKRPLLRHYTLEIDPMKEVLEREGGRGHNGLRKSLHMCRGHFVHYTADAPLFGRVTGTFWKNAHVRGSAKEGVVSKDYRVKAPAMVDNPKNR